MLSTTEGTVTKQIKVSYGDLIHQTQMSTSTLNDVLETIQTDTDLSEKISAIRSAEDKDERGKLKLQLPYFNLGLFENNERKNNKFLSTEFMIIDVDGLKGMQLKLLTLKLPKDSHVYSYFTSPSGDGLKVILRFAEPITDSKLFTDNYKLYAEWFENEFNVKTDKTSDAARACFFSSDPDLFLNNNAERLEVVNFSVAPTQPAPKRKASSKVTAKKISKPSNSSLLKPQSTGDRHGVLASAIGRFIKLGMSKEDILDIALAMNSQNDPPKAESVIVSTVEDLIGRYGNVEGSFWLSLNSKVEVLTAKFIDFLTSKGFAKVYYDKAFIYVRINDNIAEEIITTNIKDFVLEYINTIDGDSALYKGDIREIILNRVTKYFSDQLLSSVKSETLNLKSGDRETGYVYFNNGFVVAKKIIKLFELELTAIQTSKELDLKKTTTQRIYNKIREAILGSSNLQNPSLHKTISSQTQTFSISITNGVVDVSLNDNTNRTNLFSMKRTRVPNKETSYNFHYTNVKPSEIEKCLNQLPLEQNYFWRYAKKRLYSYRGTNTWYLFQHLKEIEFRYNNRYEDLFDQLIRIIASFEDGKCQECQKCQK